MKRVKSVHKSKKSNLFDNGFPIIWNLEFLKINNCMLCCSVIIEKEIIGKVGNFDTRSIEYVHPDYDYWLRALKYTDSVYVKDCCVYYDMGHGDGKNY